jgi:hypothetical protein
MTGCAVCQFINCGKYSIDDAMLSTIDIQTEPEIIGYAA